MLFSQQLSCTMVFYYALLLWSSHYNVSFTMFLLNCLVQWSCTIVFYCGRLTVTVFCYGLLTTTVFLYSLITIAVFSIPRFFASSAFLSTSGNRPHLASCLKNFP